MKLIIHSRVQKCVRAFVTFALGLGFVFSSSGCSPGMFFGSGKDSDVTDAINYRKINTACASMKLTSSTFDVPTVRAVVNCFNENQALDPIAALVKKLPDQTLQPFVDAMNLHLLQGEGRKTFYELEQTYNDLDKYRILSDILAHSSRILKNGDFFKSAIDLFRVQTFQSRASDGFLILDPDFVQAIDLLGLKDLSYNSWLELIQLGLDLSGSPAFQELSERLKTQSPIGTDLKSVTDSLHTYFTESHTYECEEGRWAEMKPMFIQAILDDGDHFFTALNRLLGNDLSSETRLTASLKTQVPKVASIFEVTLKSDSRTSVSMMEKLALAFSDMNHGIKCMGESKTIPNAAMHLLRELNEPANLADPVRYILRDNRLNLVAMAPFCKFPPRLGEHYQSLTEVVETGVMPQMAELLSVLYQEKGLRWKGCDGRGLPQEEYPLLAQLFINFLADQGRDLIGNQTGGIANLIPALKEATARDTWVDLLLLMTVPSVQDQESLKATVKDMVRPRAELRGQSIMDVFLKLTSRASKKDVYNFVASLAKYTQEKDPLIEPALLHFYKAFYVNSSHPFLDLLKVFLTESTRDVEVYNALFKIAEYPEFPETIVFLSKMADPADGRLKDLLDTMFKLAHRFIGNDLVAPQIHHAPIPEFRTQRRHQLSSSLRAGSENQISSVELTPISAVSPRGTRTFPAEAASFAWYTSDCRSLNVSFNIADSSTPDYQEQLLRFLDCQSQPAQNRSSTPGLHQSIKDAVLFLREQKTSRDQTYFDLGVQLTERLIKNRENLSSNLTPSDIQYLIDAAIPPQGRGSMDALYRVLNSVPLFVEGVTSPARAFDTTQSVLKPLLDVGGAVMSQVPESVRILESFAGKVLERSDTSQLLGDLDDVLNKTPLEPVAEESPNGGIGYLYTEAMKERIKQWVINKECVDFPVTLEDRERKLDQRVKQILDEPKNNVTNWDLVAGADPASRREPKTGWTLVEVKEALNPILKKAFDTSQSVPGRGIIDSQLNGLRYFMLPGAPGESYQNATQQLHYPPGHFLDWLYERSVDYRLITYFYPGEDKPRVRLVNTLDLLELVVINVDFPSPIYPYKNMGLDFLAEIGEAWGDLPREKWPAEIQRKYADKMPMTLLEAVTDIVNRPAWLENLSKLTHWFVGVPKLPGCYRNLPGEAPDVQASPATRHVLSLGFSAETVKDFQRRLYNLWQVNTVLRENAIGSGVGYSKGLEVLRDVFFEVYYTTPEGFRSPTDGDKNNLSMLLKQVRAGIFRQIGRQLQKYKKPQNADDPAYGDWVVLNDFFTSLIHSAKSPHMKEILVTLLSSDPEHQLIWKVFEQIFAVIDQGTDADRARMKKLALYSMSTLNRLEEWSPSGSESEVSSLMDLGLANLGTVLSRHMPFLISQGNVLKDLLKSESASRLMQVLYEDQDTSRRSRMVELLKDVLSNGNGLPDTTRVNHAVEILKVVYSDEEVRANWETFLSRVETLRASEEFKKLELDKTLRPVVRFFQQRPLRDGYVLSEQEKQVASRLILNIASVLKTNEPSELLRLAGDSANSERFYQVLQTLSLAIGRTDQSLMKNFLETVIRPSLSERPNARSP